MAEEGDYDFFGIPDSEIMRCYVCSLQLPLSTVTYSCVILTLDSFVS